MKKNKKIVLIVLVSLILFGVLFLNSRIAPKEISPPQDSDPIGKTSVVNSKLSAKKTVLEINGERYDDEITGQISVYDFMDKLRNEGKINFTEKNYAGMGKFIIAINGVKGNGEQNWIYYVNGKEAQVGISNYKINPGDVVSWKYEKNAY